MATLVPGEGAVGTFGELHNAGRKGDNLTAHHIPANAFMKAKVPAYREKKGFLYGWNTRHLEEEVAIEKRYLMDNLLT